MSRDMQWSKFIPDGLVGNDNLVPLLSAKFLGGSVKLAGHDLDGLVGLTLLHKKIGCERDAFRKDIPGLDPMTHYRDENGKSG
jgi:hypothetical protein